jgi:hypothetical protein
MANQNEELSTYFFNTQKIEKPGRTYAVSVSKWIEDLLKEGISYEEIQEGIRSNPKDFRSSAREIHKNSSGNNLLKKGRFYYHPRLQVAPPPPVITINDDGTFSKKEQEFFLRIKDSFTSEDVLEYFYARFPYIDRSTKRDIGAIEYLYTKVATPIIDSQHDKDLNAIDLLMFTIDAASLLSQDTDEKLAKLLGLSDFINYGLEVYLDKRENCIQAGINHVI